MKTHQLEPGNYYHIFNRGINGTDLFYKPENYYHFLRLYDKFIYPVADTFAWCLLRNHFHLLIRVKREDEVNLTDLPNPVRVRNPDRVIRPKPAYRYFSDLFNSYTQAINNQEKRTGSLFERPFHRIKVESEEYFRQLVIYIHTNPVKHHFTDDYRDYPWSSYEQILSLKPAKLNSTSVIGWFNDKAEFIIKHNAGEEDNLYKHLIGDNFWDYL